MAAIYEETKATPVFFENGIFTTDRRQKRLLRAPFELVVIPALGNSQYLRPRGINGITNNSLNYTGYADGVDDAFLVNGIDGFAGGDQVVLEGEHMMGNFMSSAENWQDVHKFSWL